MWPRSASGSREKNWSVTVCLMLKAVWLFLIVTYVCFAAVSVCFAQRRQNAQAQAEWDEKQRRKDEAFVSLFQFPC